MPTQVKRGFEKNVFINCPFDSEYYALLRPLLFTIVYLGFNPKIALERSDSGEQRLDKICELIKESKFSIHDLSRLKASKRDEFYRLNMPFELGLDYGSRRFASNYLKEKKYLILEKRAFDYRKALSDISGVDIKNHDNKPAKLVQAIRNWFVETAGLSNVIGPTAIWYKFNDFTSDFYTRRQNEGFSDEDLNMMPVREYINFIKNWLRADGSIKQEVQPATEQPLMSAIDGRMYEAIGPLWHQKHRKLGLIPQGLRNVDTDSAWFKSGYRGWVQGYRLVLQGLVFPEPVPLFAAWRLNSEGEATIMATALNQQCLPVTPVLLGDSTFGGATLCASYQERDGWLLTPQQLPQERRSWKHDLYGYRKETIELLFQRVIQSCDLKACPVKGWSRNGAFVLASVWLYQIIFLNNYRQGRPMAHIKEQLDLARWRIAA